MAKVTVSSDPEGLVYTLEGDTTVTTKGLLRGSAHFAKEFFKDRNDLVVAEIGVHRGGNAEQIWEYLKPKILLLVDNWDGYGETHNINYVETWHRLHGHREIIIIKGWSEDVAKIVNLDFDYIYIDAGHDYQSITTDILSWYPKVKKGGIIGGHDYFSMPAVKQVVDEWFGDKVALGEYGLAIPSTGGIGG